MANGQKKLKEERCHYCGGYAVYTGIGMSDAFKCSGCDYETMSYWDGAEYALAEWNKHMKKQREEDEKHYNPMAKAMNKNGTV